MRYIRCFGGEYFQARVYKTLDNNIENSKSTRTESRAAGYSELENQREEVDDTLNVDEVMRKQQYKHTTNLIHSRRR